MKPRTVGPWRCGSSGAVTRWLAAVGLCAVLVPAARGENVQRDDPYLMSATEKRLWLVAPETREGKRVARLYNRTRGESFNAGQLLFRRVVAVAADSDSLLTFFDDGAVYRYWPDRSAPVAERVLPRQTIPLDLATGRGRLWAIVRSDIAEQLSREATSRPTRSAGEEPNAASVGRPFDAGDAPLSLIAYDGHAWHAVAPLPAAATPPTDLRLRPRIVATGGRLYLLVPQADGQVRCFASAAEPVRWEAAGSFAPPKPAALWAVVVNRRPVAVVATRGPGRREVLQAWRPGSAGEPWRRVELRLSAMVGDRVITRYEAAGGFNQHIAVLGRDTDGHVVLRFGRLGETPAEPSISISAIIGGRAVREQIDNAIQGAMLILLIAVLMGLFVLRRGAMVRHVPLPLGFAPALRVQRLIAWLVDFAPFALISAHKLDVSWRDGLAALGRWGITPSPETLLPDNAILYWWGLTVCGYTAYALVMELWTGRTVGKTLMGLRVLSERGTPPLLWQVIVRNAMRLIEFLPQFWVFAMLVVLSRNRQRMGDIYARTIVVRGQRLVPPDSPDAGRVHPAPPDATDADRTDSDHTRGSD